MRDAHERAGRPIPIQLFPPDTWGGYEHWLDAFFELGTDRSIGMGVGPIPSRSITEHTKGWPHDEALAFRHLMRRLDGVYLASISKSGRKGNASPPRATGETFSRERFRAGLGK